MRSNEKKPLLQWWVPSTIIEVEFGSFDAETAEGIHNE